MPQIDSSDAAPEEELAVVNELPRTGPCSKLAVVDSSVRILKSIELGFRQNIEYVEGPFLVWRREKSTVRRQGAPVSEKVGLADADNG